MKKLGFASAMVLVLSAAALGCSADYADGIAEEAPPPADSLPPEATPGDPVATSEPVSTDPPRDVFDVDGDGWTSFTGAKDTRYIHVSSSAGNDSNDGLTKATPVKTIAKARTLMRNDMPDWMLLKRGDVWAESLAPASKSWTLSGRSQKEPMVIGAYGDGARPRLDTGKSSGFTVVRLGAASEVHDLLIIGIHFRATARIVGAAGFDSDSTPDGINFLGAGRDFLVEDCYLESYGNGIVLQGDTTEPRFLRNAAVRRNVVVDSYKKAALGHSQGLYVARTKSLVIEGNVFDHNGWHDTIPGAQKTQFNHDAYVQADVDGLRAQDNFFLRASSYGIEAKGGGRNDVVDNVFSDDAQGMEWGISRGGVTPNQKGASGRIAGNAIFEGRDIATNNAQGQGIEIGNANTGGVVVEDNIIAHSKSAGPYGHGIILDTTFPGSIGIAKIAVRRNTVVDWPNPLYVSGAFSNIKEASIEDNTFVDQAARAKTIPVVVVPGDPPAAIAFARNTYASANPANQFFSLGLTRVALPAWVTASSEVAASTIAPKLVDDKRDLATYMGTLGKPATKDAFFAALRGQSKTVWSKELMTRAVLGYVRAGYKR